MTFIGAWATGYGYTAKDAVSFGGSTYIATVSNSSAEPDTNSGNGGAWSLLAQAGGVGPAGPSGPGGAAATVTVGTVNTGAAGTSASVTNVGSSTAAVLNFTIPQGAAGSGGGSGSGSTSGISGAAMSHVEPSGGTPGLTPEYYSVNNSTASSTESAAVLTWVPAGCTVTALNVYSQLTAQTTLALRALATPTSSATVLLTCTVAAGPASTACSVPGGTQVNAGTFIDYSIVSENGPANPGVWTALTCN
jgi:hypothetical protein